MFRMATSTVASQGCSATVPSTLPTFPKNIFSLIIGISVYAAHDIPDLTGSRADVESMEKFLRDSNVSPEHLIILRDEDATRHHIVHELKSVAKNEKIDKGDPILIYFSGHGMQALPNSRNFHPMRNPESRIQILCPYDFSKADPRGIPTACLAAHLNRISEAKGNNITVILDCGYRGGGTRLVGTTLLRGLAPDYCDHPYPPISPEPGEPSVDMTQLYLSDLHSHVLLAACDPRGFCYEDKTGGYFTNALLHHLRTSAQKRITYRGLISLLGPFDYRQTPQCVGFHQDRHIFMTTSHIPEQEFQKLSRIDAYHVDLGTHFGLTKGSTYDVHTHDGRHGWPFLGEFIIIAATNSTAELIPCGKIYQTDLHRPSTGLPSVAYALRPGNRSETSQHSQNDFYVLTKINAYRLPVYETCEVTEGSVFRVLDEENCPLGDFTVQSVTNPTGYTILVPSPLNTLDAPQTAYGVLKKLGPEKKFEIVIPTELSHISDAVKHLLFGKFKDIPVKVYPRARANHSLTLVEDRNGAVAFEIRDKLCRDNRLTQLRDTVTYESTARHTPFARIIAILSSAADFYLHLHRSPKVHLFMGLMNDLLECYECKGDREDKKLVMEQNHLELNDDEDDTTFVFAVLNKTDMPLYVALFYFDMEDLSISSYYEPGSSKDDRSKYSVPAHDQLRIEYGSDGGEIRLCRLRQKRDVNVGYLKLYVSTKWMNYSNIKQCSPFDGIIHVPKGYEPRLSPWDSLCIPVIRKRGQMSTA
ncbi:uncharacterized protein STEHIDRAFT_116403 [Stereum hirsutum FP-91666 SS1]|uniref:Peptidase C14 caspase domain-containing protein n=1 Tax=Stereum hirsutum (strain FP-91666) TaxID=721885 RepID=R7RWG3_STEHR|nr:uncharacterized protein STEHIDRAFT_116403 [Stereum hirsutum FP-91666 SS1]EIM79706.1 hypothetical protein STEHIDRAFT_116403 [Stereum hirsutum FP-91666 SS1]